jgi:uncharacterized protein YifN (PemK superfamily)
MDARPPFYPKKRMILMCDFDRGGFTPPEMVKRHPVFLLSRNSAAIASHSFS